MAKVKKILIIHRYFSPDKTSCSEILYNLACFLSNKINNVEVITGYPQRNHFKITRQELKYFDKISNLNIVRLALIKESYSAIPRIFNAFFMGAVIFVKSIFNRYDIVICTTSPPVITALFSAIASKIIGSRFIYYCMDINPEIGMLTGDLSNPIVVKTMLILDKWTCSQASPIIVHSESMKQSIIQRFSGKKKLNFSIINSLTTQECNSKNNLSKKLNPRVFKIIYAGNLGRFQGLENVIRAFSLIKKKDAFELIFLGDGILKSKLFKLSKKLKTNVRFINQIDYQSAKELIREADIGLVPLAENLYKYAYPSKTMTYLEQGCPIIALIEEESDIAKIINSKKFGFVVSLKDHEKLAHLIENLSSDQSWKQSYKKAAINAYKENFSPEIILKKWFNVILNYRCK